MVCFVQTKAVLIFSAPSCACKLSLCCVLQVNINPMRLPSGVDEELELLDDIQEMQRQQVADQARFSGARSPVRRSSSSGGGSSGKPSEKGDAMVDIEGEDDDDLDGEALERSLEDVEDLPEYVIRSEQSQQRQKQRREEEQLRQPGMKLYSKKDFAAQFRFSPDE